MQRKANSGFTLLELIITVVILSIVMLIGIPSFRTLIADNRLTSQINEVSSVINFARSEAAKAQNETITVCPVDDPEAANPDCSGGTGWSAGWIVILDVNGDGDIDAADGDRLLRLYQPLSGGNTMTVAGLSSNDGSLIQFEGNGFPVPPSLGASAAGTITVCDDRGDVSARAVVVNVSGQTRLARDLDNNGILNDHDQQDVTCP